MIIAVTVARLYVWYNVRGKFEPFEPFLWFAMLILSWPPSIGARDLKET
jgi:hypothetical protein